jgi:WD40 repeat protein
MIRNKRWIAILLLFIPAALYWNVQEQLSWKPRRFQTGGPINDIAFSPDGKSLALGRYDYVMLKKTATDEMWENRGQLEVWKVSGQRPALAFSIAETDPVDNPRFSSKGDAIFYISRTQRLCRLDMATRHATVLWKLGIGDTQQFALAPNGQVLTTKGEEIRLHDAQTGKLLCRLRQTPQDVLEKRSAARKAQEAKDAQRRKMGIPPSTAGYVVEEDNLVEEGNLDWVQSSRDGKIACARVSDDSSFEIWNLQSGQKIARVENDSGSVNEGALSPDGERLAFGIERRVELFDIATRQTRLSLQTGGEVIRSIVWSNNSAQIAVGNSAGELMLFDATSGKRLRHFGGLKHHSLDNIAFSPDDRILASADSDDTVTLQRIR